MLGYGVVGLAHGATHLGEIAKLEGAETVALCDLDTGRLARVADEHDIPLPARYTEYEAMLKHPGLDVVVIATPTRAHHALAEAAFEAGKHVFLEKPLTLTVAEGEALARRAEVAAEKGVMSQVGYCVRSSALVGTCRDLLANGTVGEPVLLWYNMILDYRPEAGSWHTCRAEKGSKLFDCCCHYFDMMMLLAESRFDRVCAFGGPARRSGPNAADVPQVAHAILDLANGVKVTMNVSEVSPSPRTSFFGIACTRGTLEIDPYYPDGAGSIEVYAENGLYRNTIRFNPKKTSPGHLGFFEQHEVFLAAIREGTPVACTFREALELEYLNEALDRSLAEGRVVTREEVASPA